MCSITMKADETARPIHASRLQNKALTPGAHTVLQSFGRSSLRKLFVRFLSRAWQSPIHQAVNPRRCDIACASSHCLQIHKPMT